jgi:hypothetical protein
MGIFASIKNWFKPEEKKVDVKPEMKKIIKPEEKKVENSSRNLQFQKDNHFEPSSQKDGGQITYRPPFR